MNNSRIISLLLAGVLAALTNAKWIQEHRSMIGSELALQKQITSIKSNNPNCVEEQLTVWPFAGLVQDASASAMNYIQLQKLSLCLPTRGEEETEYLRLARNYTDTRNSKRFWIIISFLLDAVLFISVWGFFTNRR